MLMLDKKDGKVRNKRNRKRYISSNYLKGNYIYVTNHAVKRYQQRIKKSDCENVQQNIIDFVKRSRLIALTKHGGREIRENRGILFVCKMEGNRLNVITVLKSEVGLRFVI